jgi:iron complex outermembrane receptor protein
MKKTNRRPLEVIENVTVATALALCLPVQHCGAAEAETDALQEIVITAEHREESLQDVPIAVTAFSRDEIDKLGLQDPTGLAAQTPSLEIKGTQGESKPNVFIRGVGNNDFNATASGAVGFYADQVYQGLPSAQLFQMFDLERVEVLRGPQGTLYGRNTTGGAINFISRQPDGTTNGDFELTYGRFDEVDVHGAIQFPIAGTLSTRIAGVYRSTEGDEINDFTGAHVGGLKSYALRDITLWTPYETQSWTLNMHAARYDGNGPRYHFIPLNNGAYPESVLPIIGVTPPYHEGSDWWSGNWDLPQTERVDNIGASLTGVIKWDFATLTSISAYEKVNAYVLYDSDASPLDYVDVAYGDKSWMASEEVRLASATNSALSWQTGLYFYRDHLNASNDFDIAHFARTLFGELPNPNDPTAPANYVQRYAQPTSSIAIFGSGTYQFNDAWKGTIGARWTDDHKSIEYQTYQYEPATIGTIPLINVGLANSWNNFSESGSLDYAFSKNAMAYVSVNRGFKSGAYNGSPIFDPSTVRAVNPEFVNAYELGTKTQWFENRLTVNVAAFYNDYRDLQVFRFVPDPTTGVPTAVLDNAASAEVKGVEIELQTRPFRELRVELGASFMDAKYKSFIEQEGDAAVGSPQIDFSGNRLVGAPATHFNSVVEYTIDMPGGFRLVPRAEVVYSSTVYFDSSNNPLLAQSGYTLINGSLRLESSAGHYFVSAWIKNAANRAYATDALDLSNFGLDIAVHGAPRTYGVTLNYRFE